MLWFGTDHMFVSDKSWSAKVAQFSWNDQWFWFKVMAMVMATKKDWLRLARNDGVGVAKIDGLGLAKNDELR